MDYQGSDEEIHVFFPSKNGYVFVPPLKKFHESVLSMIKPMGGAVAEEVVIRPLLVSTWARKGRWMPAKYKILMVGFTSHGLSNEVHRGSYSGWGVVSIERRRQSVLGNSDLKAIERLYDVLKKELLVRNSTSSFRAAFLTFVHGQIGEEAVSDVFLRLWEMVKETKKLG